MANQSELPIHFFTLVLNGQPFIQYHLERFKALKSPWHWHIIEGLADLKHDTAWSLQFGANVPADVAHDGESVDGTADYLDQIAREHPERITLYRAPNGRMWDGKLEMVNAALPNLPAECLLWEVDSDELWTTEQLEHLRDLFLRNPDRMAAVFYCWYFVGPNLAINRNRRYREIEWRRAWRFRKGMRWIAHEPPVLGAVIPGSNKFYDVATQKPFTPPEMEKEGLVFQHFAYVIEPQLEFKEKYYGYKGITQEWRRLRDHGDFPVQLKQFFNWPWVDAGAMVDPLDTCGILPLAHVRDGKWILETPPAPWLNEAPEIQELQKAKFGSAWKLGYHLLPRVIKRYGLKVGVEVGVAGAGHSEAILQNTDVKRLYGVDSYRNRPGYDDMMNMPQEKLDGLHDKVQKYMSRYGERYQLVRMDSSDAAKHIEEPLDFVYIDAEHSYEGAKRDLESWFPKVRDGGIVSGHDFNHPNFPGVAQAVQEFMKRENLEVHAEDEFFWWVEKIPMEKRKSPAAHLGGGGARAGKRGILYVKWGPNNAVMDRSIRSVKAIHPELPIHVHQLPDNATLLDKAAMFAASPFEETLFLDVDTVVLDRLDYGFDMAAHYGLACSICENPWARRYGGITGDLVEYNTGVLFFTAQAKPIFDAWDEKVRTVDSSIKFYNAQNQLVTMAYNDQAGFSLAVAQSKSPPFILPFNWNFRPMWHRAWWGPIKIWHDYSDPPAGVVSFTQSQARPDSIIQFVQFGK